MSACWRSPVPVCASSIRCRWPISSLDRKRVDAGFRLRFAPRAGLVSMYPRATAKPKIWWRMSSARLARPGGPYQGGRGAPCGIGGWDAGRSAGCVAARSCPDPVDGRARGVAVSQPAGQPDRVRGCAAPAPTGRPISTCGSRTPTASWKPGRRTGRRGAGSAAAPPVDAGTGWVLRGRGAQEHRTRDPTHPLFEALAFSADAARTTDPVLEPAEYLVFEAGRFRCAARCLYLIRRPTDEADTLGDTLMIELHCPTDRRVNARVLNTLLTRIGIWGIVVPEADPVEATPARSQQDVLADLVRSGDMTGSGASPRRAGPRSRDPGQLSAFHRRTVDPPADADGCRVPRPHGDGGLPDRARRLHGTPSSQSRSLSPVTPPT